jgi:hypothetical protein
MMQLPEAQREHKWLQQLVGEWTTESECQGPDGQPMKSKGIERVHMMGDLWVVCEGTADMPGGGQMTSLMIVGYDPAKKKFVGSWQASCMTHMFVYEGTLDAETNTLALESDGPDFMDPTKTARYRDSIVLKSSNERLLQSCVVLPGGGTTPVFMTATYRRK